MNHSEPNWIIHYVKNGFPCQNCGQINNPFLDQICDAHTHGLNRYKNHLEFQIVLDAGPNAIGHILNELGYMVRSGKKLHNGDVITGILDDSPVRLLEMDDSDGNRVLRVIVPDPNMKWPDDPGCEYPYNMQGFHLALLQNPHNHHCEENN